MMTYKGYSANLEVDVEAGIIFGQVLDINDVVTFIGKTDCFVLFFSDIK